MFVVERGHANLSRLLVPLALPLILTTGPAFALTKEAAIESCRERVGRPIVMACMRGGGNTLLGQGEGCAAPD